MARAEISTTIDRSVEDVFTVLTDVTKNAIWSSTAVEGRLITPGPVALGTTAREASVFLGRRIQVDSQIVEFEPNRRFAYVTSSGPFAFNGSFGSMFQCHFGYRRPFGVVGRGSTSHCRGCGPAQATTACGADRQVNTATT